MAIEDIYGEWKVWSIHPDLLT